MPIKASREDYPSIVATIGDSTFFHSGIPALINAVVQKRPVRSGDPRQQHDRHDRQPADSSRRVDADWPAAPRILLPDLIKACGVRFVEEGDPYQFDAFLGLLKQAGGFARAEDGGVAVVIAKHPCLMDRSHREAMKRRQVVVNDKCKGCDFCVKHFECPALVAQGKEEPIVIDPMVCVGCGVCVHVCPHKALEVGHGLSNEEPFRHAADRH